VATLRPTIEELTRGISLPTGAGHTIIVPPLIVRVRMIGILFETDKTFVLPSAMAGLRQLTRIYDAHAGKTILVSGHTDTAGTTEHNLSLSVERAKSVAAFLRNDNGDWLARYDDTQVSARRLPDETIVAPQFGGGTRSIIVKKGAYQGVDINRNYATSTWGQEAFVRGHATTSRDPRDSASGIWAGPAAGSEIETQCISALMAAQSFRSSITYHNFSQLLLYPSQAKKDGFVQFVGKGMSELINAQGNPYTYEAGDALYPTSGDLMEFSYEQAPGRPTFTPEVRPNENAPKGAWFSALPEAEIEPTFKENLGAALALINAAGFDAPAKSLKVTWSGDAQAVAQVVRNCWKVFEGFEA
jgi:hypothetical protein